MYDKKIAIVIKDDLLTWQKLNVAAFLTSSIALAFPETHGRPLTDAGGTAYLPFIKHPVLIYKASSGEQIDRAFNRAKERALHIGIYTMALFATKNEEENLAVIAATADDDMDLAGIILYGENKKVDKAIDGLKFHS